MLLHTLHFPQASPRWDSRMCLDSAVGELEPCHLRWTHSLPRGSRKHMAHTNMLSYSHLSWKADPELDMLFWASELKAERKHRVFTPVKALGIPVESKQILSPTFTIDSPWQSLTTKAHRRTQRGGKANAVSNMLGRDSSDERSSRAAWDSF